MPATRSASGPMPAPRTLAPTSVGAPMRLTVFIWRELCRKPPRRALLQDASKSPKAQFEFAEWVCPIHNPDREYQRMLAMQYRGPYRVRATQKAEPRIEHPNDAIVRVMRSCICGSDLHLYHGLVPDTRVGHTFGHEVTGVVQEVGRAVTTLRPGDRVVVPFNISCGSCFFCERGLTASCDRTNPNSQIVGGVYGYSP